MPNGPSIVDLIGASMAAGDLPGGKELVTEDARRYDLRSLGRRVPPGLLYTGDTGTAGTPSDAQDAGASPVGDGVLPAADATVAGADPGSEWGVTVVRVLGFEPIMGADFVHVAKFAGTEIAADGELATQWDYPVVVQKSAFEAGDKAVYVPVDSVFPDGHPEFAFLGSASRRLRAKKLRGVYSEGLLVPWRDVAAIVARSVPDAFGDDAAEKAEKTAAALDAILPVGAEVSGFLGIGRYTQRVGGSAFTERTRSSANRAGDSSVFPVYTVANARKGEGIQRLAGDTRVIVTEKLHGANIRFGWVRSPGEAVGADDDAAPDVRFFLGSHRVMRNAGTEDSWFTACVQDNDLFFKSEKCPGFAFYGEVLGVQDLTYGSSEKTSLGFRLFDVYSTASERWLNWGEIKEIARVAGFDHVPVLYDGPLDECNYREMAEGETTLDGANHVREGVVVRTFAGGSREDGPQRKWKYVGQGYKLRDKAADLVAD